VSFSPLLIAFSDRAFSEIKTKNTYDIFKIALPISVLWVFASGDPRTLVYSAFIIAIIAIYYVTIQRGTRFNNLIVLSLVVLFFVLMESRIIYVLIVSHQSLFNIGSSIVSQQSWMLTYFFPPI
jgi:hypothetical protein